MHWRQSLAGIVIALTAFCALFGAGAEETPLTVVFFGDSITGPRPGEAYQQNYVKFADLVGLMLEARTGGPVRVVNSGWAGDRSYADPGKGVPGAQTRVERDVVAHHPDVAVVLIGGYDQADRRDNSRRAMTAIFSRLKEAGIPTLVLTYHAARADNPDGYKGFQHITANNELIEELAKANGHPVLAMEAPMAAAVQGQGRKALLNDHDGVHLKPAGELVYARAIFARLMDLGWVRDTTQARSGAATKGKK